MQFFSASSIPVNVTFFVGLDHNFALTVTEAGDAGLQQVRFRCMDDNVWRRSPLNRHVRLLDPFVVIAFRWLR
jgi:hypothetical protein